MAVSATDRWKIVNNIIARAGGIERLDLHAALAQAEAQINLMEQNSQNNPVTAPISPPMEDGIQQEEIMPNSGQNTP